MRGTDNNILQKDTKETKEYATELFSQQIWIDPKDL